MSLSFLVQKLYRLQFPRHFIFDGLWWPQYWLDPTHFLVKVVHLWQTYPTPFTACRSDAWFSRSDEGGANTNRDHETSGDHERWKCQVFGQVLCFLNTLPGEDLRITRPGGGRGQNLSLAIWAFVRARSTMTKNGARSAAVFQISGKNRCEGQHLPPPSSVRIKSFCCLSRTPWFDVAAPEHNDTVLKALSWFCTWSAQTWFDCTWPGWPSP